ncbi:uncharacterized protein TNCV_4132381 [Trichonephila clavipes]|nr:uncharacterized protein TNCV_4132381 [Trichonephila clavipes]
MDGNGLSQADAARRLNVSRSVVQRLWDQYQSEDSAFRRPVPGRPRATTPAEDRFQALSARRRRTTTVPQLVADHFQAHREEKNLRYYGAKIVFTMQVCMQEDQLWRLLIWRNSALDTINPTLLKDTVIEVVESWFGQDLSVATLDLHVFHGGTVTGLRYQDEILDPYVRPYAAAGNDFIFDG